jgi:hypothetical protein
MGTMNIFVNIFAAILLAILMPVAQAMDGNGLLAGYNSYKSVKSGMTTGSDAYKGGLFDGYVSGIYDSAVGITLCAPADVKSGQIQEVVGQFLETHPATLHRSAILLATQALMKSFPCK